MEEEGESGGMRSWEITPLPQKEDPAQDEKGEDGMPEKFHQSTFTSA